MVTGITYQGEKFSNNLYLLKAMEKAMHHHNRVISILLVMAK